LEVVGLWDSQAGWAVLLGTEATKQEQECTSFDRTLDQLCPAGPYLGVLASAAGCWPCTAAAHAGYLRFDCTLCSFILLEYPTSC